MAAVLTGRLGMARRWRVDLPGGDALVLAEQQRWRAVMAAALREADLLVLPTVPFFARLLEAPMRPGYLAFTSPVNLAGLPALALPVPTGQRLPASLQLIGGPDTEALLLATAAMIEAAI